MSKYNGITSAFERDERVFGAFVAPHAAAAYGVAESSYEALIFEAEHHPWDAPQLRTALQYLLSRRRIQEASDLLARPTPLVRIPANGGEGSQWHAKQALDLGAYGIVWPHVTQVEQARNAVAACRYPSSARDTRGPRGLRGDSPATASRYWGVTREEYYQRAGVWSLDEDGEILVAIMIESTEGIANLDAILRQVPGIGLVLIGEGDLSQELGVPRQFEHPAVVEGRSRVVEICQRHAVAVGHPHVTEHNVETVLDEGYQFLISGPVTSYPGMDRGRDLLTRT